MRKASKLVVAGAITLVAFGTGAKTLAWPVNAMDRPLRKQVVILGASPYYPGGKVPIKLTCYFYGTLTVKEYDAGQKGAEWIAIVPIQKDAAPACVESRGQGERVIHPDEWSGYFKGAKGNLVFIDAADGMNLGLPFAVYDSGTGKKIFEDSAYDSRIENRKVEESPFNRLRVRTTADGMVSLIYLRVVEAGCELHFQKASCWPQVKEKFELKSAQAPVCSRYKNVPPPAEPALAYPVEVSLSAKPTIKTIEGPVECWPMD